MTDLKVAKQSKVVTRMWTDNKQYICDMIKNKITIKEQNADKLTSGTILALKEFCTLLEVKCFAGSFFRGASSFPGWLIV